jgi:mycothiol synthase
MNQIEVVSQLGHRHLKGLSSLLEASTLADGHEPLGEHKFLRLRQGGDLAQAVLAYDGDCLTGYAHILAFGEGADRRVSCEFVVHPDERGKGIGTLLLSHATTQAAELGASRMDVWAYNDSRISADIAQRMGFVPSRRLLHLHRHLSGTPRVGPPAGVTTRSFVPGIDDEAWLALNARIFAGHPENGVWTIDDLRARFDQPWFRPDDFLLVELDGVMAGFSWLKVEERRGEGRVGEIYVIGTAAEVRGRGLGKYLVSRSLAHLSDRDVRVAAIYVDAANLPAVALYEQSGFHYHHVDVCYSRDLSVDAHLPTVAGAAA